MNRFFLLITLLVVTGLTDLTFAQVKKAKKQMSLYNYSAAIDILQKTIRRNDGERKEAILLMAECYRKQNDVRNARGWYARAIETGNTDPQVLFNYAGMLRACGEYDSAKRVYLEYAGKSGGDLKALTLAGYCDSAVKWRDVPARYEIRNAKDLNSPQAEFGAVLYQEGINFASDRLITKGQSANYGWTGNGYLHLFNADPVFSGDLYGDFKAPQPAADLLNQAYHDGPASFNYQNTEIFFNRTYVYRDKGKKEQDKIRTHLLKIFSSVKKKSKWTEPEPFFLNNNDYSVGHPALSRDGKSLYFVSDMKGGYGGTDLYMCRREDSRWGQPVNLGPVVNTYGNEMFPFMTADGDLYFASDRHAGFGGLDIFVTRKENDSTWMKPSNLFQPVNSSFDDFSLCSGKDGQTGFFSSNRPGGMGSDDIYQFRKIPGKEATQPAHPMILAGYVKDKTTRDPIANATVFILDEPTGMVLILKTDTTGLYSTTVTSPFSCRIKAMQTGYIADCLPFHFDTENTPSGNLSPRDLLLDHLKQDKAFTLENIYYDLDKWYIRPDAQPSLDYLVSVMKENPVSIELGSHTDSRASDAYNLELSQKRAESAVRYIVLQGVNPARITARGYGETQLVNRCSNGVQCTDMEHQMNRRTEFRVVSWFDDKNGESFDLSRYLPGDQVDVRTLPNRFFEQCHQ
jgi:outer membrane protein OmpA-like peptidoglycan-associated protein/tetratricopeptide (TPR) repeat protein